MHEIQYNAISIFDQYRYIEHVRLTSIGDFLFFFRLECQYSAGRGWVTRRAQVILSAGAGTLVVIVNIFVFAWARGAADGGAGWEGEQHRPLEGHGHGHTWGYGYAYLGVAYLWYCEFTIRFARLGSGVVDFRGGSE